jgi:hypothetical protein
VTSGFVTT